MKKFDVVYYRNGGKDFKKSLSTWDSEKEALKELERIAKCDAGDNFSWYENIDQFQCYYDTDETDRYDHEGFRGAGLYYIEEFREPEYDDYDYDEEVVVQKGLVRIDAIYLRGALRYHEDVHNYVIEEV